MTDKTYDPGEIRGFLSLMPFLAEELADGGRTDLSDRLREETKFEFEEFNDLLRIGLELGSITAFEIARYQRIGQLEDMGATPGQPDDVLQSLDAHWEAKFEERLFRPFEVKEEYGDILKLLLALRDDHRARLAKATQPDEPYYRMKQDFENHLYRVESELATKPWHYLEMLLESLPEEFGDYFDSHVRVRVMEDFNKIHGPGAAEVSGQQGAFKQEWEQKLSFVARDFLMNLYAVSIRLEYPRDRAIQSADASAESGIPTVESSSAHIDDAALIRMVTDYFPFLAHDLNRLGRYELAEKLSVRTSDGLYEVPVDLPQILEAGMELNLDLAFSAERNRLIVEHVRMSPTLEKAPELLRKIEATLDARDRFISAKRHGEISEMRDAQNEFTKAIKDFGADFNLVRFLDLMDAIRKLDKAKERAARHGFESGASK